MKKNYKIILGLAFSIVFITFIFIYLNTEVMRNRELIKFCINSDIIGRISVSDFRNKMSYIELLGDSNKYYILDKNFNKGKELHIHMIAEKGDSIYKKKNNDTITIIKMNGERYLFLMNIRN